MGAKRKINLKAILLILLGSISWSLVMVKSGVIYSFGLGFWGPNGHDGVWHIALASSLARGSFDMPVFAGETLKNYHLGFDLFLALINKLTKIPISNLYFQILPPVISLLVGFLVYKFVLGWRKKEKEALWAVFFTYFAGSAGWILGKGESAFWSQQAISTLINPPFALSLVFLLLGLIFMKKRRLLAVICFGILIQIKAYAGVLALGGLMVTAIFRFVKTKKLDLTYVFLGSLILSLALFLPFNKNASSLIVFKPF